MIACRPTSWNAIFCAECRAALAITTAEATRSGNVAAQLNACIPPIDPPTTANSRDTPR
jgi:hypothetical protein